MISPSLVYDPTAELVARQVIGAGAYVVRQTDDQSQWFTWKSGIVAPCYTDCRVLPGNPGASSLSDFDWA
jgi:hypothetical protein